MPAAPLLVLPSSRLERPCGWTCHEPKRKANQEDPRGVSLDIVEPLNQLQQSPTCDLLTMREKQTPSLFKPPKPSFL